MAYQIIKDVSNIFHVIRVPHTLHPYILYESHNALEYNGSVGLYNFKKDIIVGGSYFNTVISI